MPQEGDLLQLAGRLVDGCPSPALLVEAGGRLRTANRAATALLGLRAGASEPQLRDLLGVGWRELEVIARDARADLVAELPDGSRSGRRSARVRLESVLGDGGRLEAVVAFLDLAGPVAAGRYAREPGFDALFGHDPELAATKLAAERFAATLLPVLLLAETGTGKELLARAIHGASARRAQPFVAINCGALSPQLLESELFGYAPGAFTGANRDGNEGKIGAAHGGTLFLDEVAEMPSPLQALLLRVLEDGTYYRVGDSHPRQADVRLICATCMDLDHLVAEGRFRQDLYYRINGACLGLPPVRQRSDVAELARHLLLDLAAQQGLPAPPEVAAEVAELVPRLPWPGNVRQLKTTLLHALILADDGEIRLEHLPRNLTAAASLADAAPPPARSPHAADGARPAGAAPGRPGGAPVRTLHELERERLRRAVDQARGNLSKAAETLGIARSTLYRRLRKHGML